MDMFYFCGFILFVFLGIAGIIYIAGKEDEDK